MFKTTYKSPIGDLLLAEKDNRLVGLWFEGQQNYLSSYKDEMYIRDNCEVFLKTKNWLDRYFNGEKPEKSEIIIEPYGTEFRKLVWEILCKIPYGETITYKEIAKKIEIKKGISKMSPQAVGGAVGNNPISIIIPCHRVIGTDGCLTGYAGGISKKIWLLEHEGIEIKK